MKTGTYLVRYRRDLKVKRKKVQVPFEADLVDGKSHVFSFGWPITQGDSQVYAGEVAMIPDRAGWPSAGPSWIASGDLELIEVL